jgi:MFS family permease
MMKRLRGRNLKHPGCLIGVTLGVIFGIIIAGVMASVYNVPLNTILWTWLAIILFLAALGWIIGSRLSSRFPAEETPVDALAPASDTIVDSPPAASDQINIPHQ